MKKTLLFLISATAMIMAGCSNDDFGGATQGMTLNATVEQPASRATMTESNDGSYKFSFTDNDNDKLNVTNSKVESYYTFTKNGETFTSSDAQTTTALADWYAYFPGNTVNLARQTGDLAGVANYYACAGMTASATTGADGLTIALKPQVAILRIVKVDGISTTCDINVKTSEGYVSSLEATKGTTAGFAVQTEKDKVTLLSAKEPGTYYIAVPAGVKIAIYNGGNLLKTTKAAGLAAGKYYTVTTGPVRDKAEAIINGKSEMVEWVQLWAGGPKFAKQNVATKPNMNWTTAVKNEFWGGNWRVPTKDEMSGLIGSIGGGNSFTTNTVKVEYLQENNEFGFKFTGVQPGYTGNSIFLPTVGDKHTINDGGGVYWTSYQDEHSYGIALSLYYQKEVGLYTYFMNHNVVSDYSVVVRPVLNEK